MEGKALDLTGQKFGKLTAIRPTEERGGSGAVVWECLCDCGKTTFVDRGNLISGRSQSCGCSRGIDLTGQKFGKLTAVRPTEERRGNNEVVWECVCDCGKTTFVDRANLVTGGTKSCGCSRIKDLTGQKFGLLTVVGPTERRQGRSVVWECLCDCGNTSYVRALSLVSGRTKSCGCLRKKKAGANEEKK